MNKLVALLWLLAAAMVVAIVYAVAQLLILMGALYTLLDFAYKVTEVM